MNLSKLSKLLGDFRGCTFASLDTTVELSTGMEIVTKGLGVMLFNSGHSGYEAMVKRRLKEIGRDPSGFKVGALPWGEKVGHLPLIVNRGKYYLQTIPFRPGASEGFVFGQSVPVESLRRYFRPYKDYPSQGLPPDRQVHVRTFSLDSIDEIRLMGERL